MYKCWLIVFVCVAVTALLFQAGKVGARLSLAAWGHRYPLNTTLLLSY